MLGNFRYGRFKDHVLMTNDSGCFVFLSESEFQAFIADQIPHDSDLWNKLAADFFCFDEAKEVYLRKIKESVQKKHAYLFVPTSLFILAVTNRCNNRCVYCQAKGSSNESDMREDVVRKIIERIADSPANKINIEFQGGEPLINFPAIKIAVESAEKLLDNKKVEFSLVSNLTYLSDEIAEFIEAHKISVSTSLDGPRELHDKNRPSNGGKGSYNQTIKGVELLKRRGIHVGAIQTTTKFSLPFAKQIVNEYKKLGMDSIFLRPLTRLGAAAMAWDAIGYSPEEYLDFYREGLSEILRINIAENRAFSETHASLFLEKIFGDTAQNYMELRSPCGAGIGQMAFTSNGDVYTCDEGRMMAEMGDSFFRLGNVFKNDYNEWIESTTCKAVCASSLLESLPTCCDCVYSPFCGVCPVINYAMTGSLHSQTPNDDRCKIYKGILNILFEYIYANDMESIDVMTKWIT